MSSNPSLFGVATAFHGTKERTMTTSVVCGPDKEQLRVDYRIDHRIVPGTQNGIKVAVDNLVTCVEGAMQAHQANEVVHPVPVVFGVADGFESEDIAQEMHQACPGSLTDKDMKDIALADLPMTQVFAKATGIPVSRNGVSRELLSKGLENILRKVSSQDRLQLEPRGYGCAEDSCGLDVAARTETARKLISDDLRATFNRLLCKEGVDSQTENDRDELDETVREIARKFAKPYTDQLRGKPMIQRFFQASTNTDLNEYGDIRHFIFMVPRLRQVYGKELIKQLNIEHNICIKSFRDTKDPPFANVCATYMADHMDNRDGTDPCVVLLQH